MKNKSKQEAANIRWAKHRDKMRELEGLKNEVLSLREANEEKDKIIEMQTEQSCMWEGRYGNSERIKKDCQREKITLLTEKKALTNSYYDLERQNKTLKVGVMFLLAVVLTFGAVIFWSNFA